MWLYSYKKGNLGIVTDTLIGIMPCDDAVWDQGAISTSQKTPKINIKL